MSMLSRRLMRGGRGSDDDCWIELAEPEPCAVHQHAGVVRA
jgi:hypothetical protein